MGFLCLEEDTARNVIDGYDADADGLVDKREFLRLMCPVDRRLPEMSGDERDLLGKLVSDRAAAERRFLIKSESKFAHASSGGLSEVLEEPPSVFPEVSEEEWKLWNDMFDRLDSNKDNRVDVMDLQSSGLLSKDVCRYLASVIDADDKSGFSRDSFLEALLDVNQLRRRTFSVGRSVR